ncbi:hypothetical protein [Paludibacterium denitrificans]|nr:hypothetical protein [Paludibacterium denitrificans]
MDGRIGIQAITPWAEGQMIRSRLKAEGVLAQIVGMALQDFLA